jgi:hypothetical protein
LAPPNFSAKKSPGLQRGAPAVLAIIGYPRADRFMRASLWFACLLTVPFFTTSNFEEVRTQAMLLPLLAPAALVGLRIVMQDGPTLTAQANNPKEPILER